MDTTTETTTSGRSRKEFFRNPPWWFRDIVITAMLTLVFLLAQWLFEYHRSKHAERVENLQFVREASTVEYQERLFAELDLSGQRLSGLFLLDADFAGAHLHRTDLSRTDLEGALFSGANLTGADLRGAHLSYATLSTLHLPLGSPATHTLDLYAADLTGARLEGTDLSHTKLAGVDFTGSTVEAADLTGACYDHTTTWPEGFQPPPDPPPPTQCGISAIPDHLRPPRPTRHLPYPTPHTAPGS